MIESERLVGSTAVIKVPEMNLNDFTATQLLPNLNTAVLAKHPEWIDSRIYDVKSERYS